MLAVGQIFIVVVYAQLILENAEIYQIPHALVDQIFDVLLRDMSHYALDLRSKPSTTEHQMDYCMRLLRKPVADPVGFDKLYDEHIVALAGAYEMNP